MYSDGLVERRGASVEDAMIALQQAAAALDTGLSLPLDELCDALIDSVLHGARPGDVTLLAARRNSSGEPAGRS